MHPEEVGRGVDRGVLSEGRQEYCSEGAPVSELGESWYCPGTTLALYWRFYTGWHCHRAGMALHRYNTGTVLHR